MDLARFFTAVGAAVACVFLLSVCTLYLVAWRKAEHAAEERVEAVAAGVARNLQSLVARTAKTLEKIASDPELVPLLHSGDAQKLAAQETAYSRLLPGALNLRIFRAGIDIVDGRFPADLGFADFVMVQDAEHMEPRPAVHAYGSAHGHLAIAARIDADRRVFGTILLSFAVGELQNVLSEVALDRGAIEVRQGSLSLGYLGEGGLKEAPPSGALPVARTTWEVFYWKPSDDGRLALEFAIAASIFLASVAAVTWFAYKRLAYVLGCDERSIGNLKSEVINGVPSGTYPLKLKDLAGLIDIPAKFGSADSHDHRQREAERRPPEAEDARASRPPVRSPSSDGPVEAQKTPDSHPPASIFRRRDIRGDVQRELTTPVVYELGRAIGSEVCEQGLDRVIVARDGRQSSPELSRALIQGLLDSGRDVVDLGMVPLPVLYFATGFLSIRSAVMVTGSHYASRFNGLKIMIDADVLDAERIQGLRRRIQGKNLVAGHGSREARNLVGEYIAAVKGDLHLYRPLRVVVDCGNGVTGRLAPELLRALGCEIIPLFCEVDGGFPNHLPDPGSLKNVAALIDKVIEESADLGVAFDGDGDRLGVIDASAKVVLPDRLAQLFALDILSRHAGADIILDPECSREVVQAIVKHSGHPIIWDPTESALEAKVKESDAMLAVHMSGHLFFKERWHGFDDAFYAFGRLLEIVSGDPRPTDELFAALRVDAPLRRAPVRAAADSSPA